MHCSKTLSFSYFRANVIILFYDEVYLIYKYIILNLISKYIETVFALDRVRIALLKHCLITSYVCFNPTCLTKLRFTWLWYYPSELVFREKIYTIRLFTWIYNKSNVFYKINIGSNNFIGGLIQYIYFVNVDFMLEQPSKNKRVTLQNEQLI